MSRSFCSARRVPAKAPRQDVDAVPGDPPYLDRGHAAGPDPARARRSGTAMVATMQSGALVSDEVVNGWWKSG